ncbi:MAG: OmpA family protein [Clostridia bacterium]|nr:OmpA family protein [Clostridia bacterium]
MSKHKVKVEKDNAERWLLTYADLMNLLLIFFIVLYAMSQVDQSKFDQLAASLREAFGAGTATKIITQNGAFGNSTVPFPAIAPSPVIPSTQEEEQLNAAKEQISELIQKQGLGGSVDVTINERGVEISIKEKVLFKSGSADIEQSAIKTVQEIGKTLFAIPGKHIRIEGHTDSDPIRNSRFPDNQELSTARANSVWRILVKDVGIDPKKLSATGYGEFRPKFKNDTAEHKAHNRRVDIVILKDALDKSESGVSKTIIYEKKKAPSEDKAKVLIENYKEKLKTENKTGKIEEEKE